MSAVLFIAFDVGYGNEGKRGKKRGELNLGLRFALRKEWVVFQGQRLCEVKQKMI